MARVAPPQFRASPKVCVYCGNAATTRDHVPPRAVFVPPVPNNLKTVPACRTCNENLARIDQEFVPSAMLAASNRNPQMLAIFQREVMPKAWKNRRLHRDILATEVPVAYSVETREPTLFMLGVPYPPMAAMAVRLARAFHWDEQREILPADVPIQPLVIEDLDHFEGKSFPWQQRNIGDHFHYGFCAVPDRPHVAVWYFVFYEGLLLTAWVGFSPDAADQ